MQKSALTGALASLPAVWVDAAEPRPSRSPNEKLNIACIGIGGQGASDTDQVSTENIVALCDVDDAYAAKTFNKYPKAKRYKDYRVMMDEMNRQIDAVVVSTPDHHHAPASVLAMKHGKHVYCQKPLTHTVYEARVMMETARKQKVTTQMGNQGHPNYARLVEVIQSGAIGPVHEVHVWTDRPIWPQGMERPKESQPVPATLDWDLWLGPAPFRPYNSAYLPFVWRGWWDFGTGALGDMACHIMDGAFWSLGLKYPVSIEAQGEPHMPESAPKWSIIHYEFPKRGKMPSVRLTWYDGGKKPSEEVLEGHVLPKDSNGSLFIGSKGKILIEHGGQPKRMEGKNLVDITDPAPYLPRVDNHYQEWVRACKTGGKTGSNFDYAATMTESVLLGNVALRVGKKVEWDAKKMRATNAPEADELIRTEYRKGWSL
jgi:predicted dehydrogenase